MLKTSLLKLVVEEQHCLAHAGARINTYLERLSHKAGGPHNLLLVEHEDIVNKVMYNQSRVGTQHCFESVCDQVKRRKRLC